MRKTHSFKVLYDLDPIVTAFIPVEEEKRARLYKIMSDRGCELPEYSTLTRSNMRPQDLMVVLEECIIQFMYDDKIYELVVKPGLIFDCASVPNTLVQGDLNKFGQHVEMAALVHDILFNMQLLPFDDANNVFNGFLKHSKLIDNFTIGLYTMGVRSPIGKMLYMKNNPETSWMKGKFIWTE